MIIIISEPISQKQFISLLEAKWRYSSIKSASTDVILYNALNSGDQSSNISRDLSTTLWLMHHPSWTSFDILQLINNSMIHRNVMFLLESRIQRHWHSSTAILCESRTSSKFFQVSKIATISFDRSWWLRSAFVTFVSMNLSTEDLSHRSVLFMNISKKSRCQHRSSDDRTRLSHRSGRLRSRVSF